MFSSIGKWMTCAVLLSFGVFSQEAATDAKPPVEYKEQKGEVLGSLGQTVDKLVPNVNIDMGLHTSQYKHGILWDKNVNADMDVTFSWMPVQNGILSIGLNGRVPLEDSKRKVSETTYGYVEKKNEDGSTYRSYEPIRSKRKSISDFKDGDELDEFELRALYTHKLKDVIPYIDEMNISVGWSYVKLNDIYTKISEKDINQIGEWEAGNIGDASWTKYYLMHKYSLDYRKMTRQEFKLAISLDNILKSDIYNLTPNMSINLETTGHIWMQYGVKFDMPVNIVSDKLKWKNSMDVYWYDKGYFRAREYRDDFITDKEGNINENKTNEYEKAQKAAWERNGWGEYKKANNWMDESSSSGFKTLNVQTALEYAFNSNISISPYVSAVWYYSHLTYSSSADKYFYNIDRVNVWYGINLSVNF